MSNGATATIETTPRRGGAETLEEAQARIEFLEQENDDLADANAAKDTEIAVLKANENRVELEPAVAEMLKIFIERANARREKSGQRVIKDVCYWASNIVNSGITAAENGWKSHDKYTVVKNLTDALAEAAKTGNTAEVTRLLPLLVAAKAKK